MTKFRIWLTFHNPLEATQTYLGLAQMHTRLLVVFPSVFRIQVASWSQKLQQVGPCLLLFTSPIYRDTFRTSLSKHLFAPTQLPMGLLTVQHQLNTQVTRLSRFSCESLAMRDYSFTIYSKILA